MTLFEEMSKRMKKRFAGWEADIRKACDIETEIRENRTEWAKKRRTARKGRTAERHDMKL